MNFFCVSLLLVVLYSSGTVFATEVEQCKDGETKKDDCNDCSCAGGVWGCTEMACPTTSSTPKTIPTAVSSECKPGETKMLDCNHCFCANGLWACTLKGCIHPKVRRDTPECKPGEKLPSSDCNSCFCTQDGKNKACTLMACPPKPKPVTKREAECTPGTTFRKDCNTCTCGSTGIAICTQIFCSGPSHF